MGKALSIRVLKHGRPGDLQEIESFLVPVPRDEEGNLTLDALRCLESAIDSVFSSPEDRVLRINVEGR